ncbi:TIGR01906 family membrane protein [Alloiococcus sp. CFN-8]|uniref:TIGR01906 family membrane protein n=1 Tax=Alloiococcus sp. CFN-8 TaxID=3416081 RepID=UPI003CECD26C
MSFLKVTKRFKISTIIMGLALAIFILGFSVKFVLNFTPLYSFDISYLSIDERVGMSKEALLENYKTVVNYIESPFIDKLVFPDFPMSREGEIHFYEVKEIFNKFDILFYGSLIVLAALILYRKKKRIKDYSYLKVGAYLSLILPLVLALPFAVNFSRAFVIFHELFFDNDYWIFDPATDPIILALPEEFFFHCALVILAVLILGFIASITLYKRLNKANKA